MPAPRVSKFPMRALMFGAVLAAAAMLPAPVVAAPSPAPAVKKPSPYPSTPAANAPVELVEELEGGARINWSAGRMSVSGVGTPGDRGAMSYRRTLSARAARADAYRKLASALELVRVDASSRIKDLAVIDDALRTRLNDFVKGSKLLETNYWPDGSAELVLGCDLKGERSLATLIGAQAGAAAAAKTAPVPGASAAPPVPVLSAAASAGGTEVAASAGPATPTPRPDGSARGQEAKEIVTEPVSIRGTYSALIVDGKGLGGQPAIMPAIRDKDGKAIELGYGAIKYLRDGAELDPAAGVNPLRVKALRPQGTLRADLVLGPEASEQLKTALRDKKMAGGYALLLLL